MYITDLTLKDIVEASRKLDEKAVVYDGMSEEDLKYMDEKVKQLGKEMESLEKVNQSLRYLYPDKK